MKLPKLNFEQTIQRVSQMRRLALSLRESYEKQYKLKDWLARFHALRTLPADQMPTVFSKADLRALHTGFRESWSDGDFATIVEVAKKLPAEVLRQDHLLTSYAAAARTHLTAGQ